MSIRAHYRILETDDDRRFKEVEQEVVGFATLREIFRCERATGQWLLTSEPEVRSGHAHIYEVDSGSGTGPSRCC